MKILAILALVATIAGAGAVLYGINTLAPQVVQTAANVTGSSGVGSGAGVVEDGLLWRRETVSVPLT